MMRDAMGHEQSMAARRPSSMKKQDRLHAQALEISSELTETWRRMYRPMAAKITPERVVGVLNAAGIRPVLMGAHGLGGWRSEPRATLDVDLLVRKRDIPKAIRSVSLAFPELTVKDEKVVTRFEDPAIGKVVIDIMKPTQEVFRHVFRHLVPIGATHDIPDLEMALVAKFAAMTSPMRPPVRRGQDVVDFMDIVQHNKEALDHKKLSKIAEKVFPGGGAEISQLVDDILAGRKITI